MRNYTEVMKSCLWLLLAARSLVAVGIGHAGGSDIHVIVHFNNAGTAIKVTGAYGC